MTVEQFRDISNKETRRKRKEIRDARREEARVLREEYRTFTRQNSKLHKKIHDNIGELAKVFKKNHSGELDITKYKVEHAGDLPCVVEKFLGITESTNDNPLHLVVRVEHDEEYRNIIQLEAGRKGESQPERLLKITTSRPPLDKPSISVDFDIEKYVMKNEEIPDVEKMSLACHELLFPRGSSSCIQERKMSLELEMARIVLDFAVSTSIHTIEAGRPESVAK